MDGLAATFRQTLLISLRASLLVLMVYGIRMIARGMTAKYRCMIWLPVFLAFLCPVSFGIPVTVPRETAEEFLMHMDLQWDDDSGYLAGSAGQETGRSAEKIISVSDAGVSREGIVEDEHVSAGGTADESAPESREVSGAKIRDAFVPWVAAVWVSTAAGLMMWQLVRYLGMKRKLRTAIKYQCRVYVSDQIASPVLLGYLHPGIYLPRGLNEEVMGYAIMHESMHLRRRDHICKLIVFLVCAVYWWNPLVWLAYRSYEADMERACDEAVLEAFGVSRGAYARALLDAACTRSSISCAVGFGGNGTRYRIKNILNYRHAGSVRRGASALTAAVFTVLSLLQFQTEAFSGSGQLSLAVSISQEAWLRPVLEKYQSLYPGVELHVEIYNDLVPARYQMASNTETGEEPDLILRTGLWMNEIREMMQEGQFASLDRLIASDEDWNENDYVTAVIDSGKYEGSQYVIPLTYHIFFAVTSEKVMQETGITPDNCSDLVTLMKKLADLYDMEYCERILVDTGDLESFPQIIEGALTGDDSERPGGLILEEACEAYRRLYEDETSGFMYWGGTEDYELGCAIAEQRVCCYFPYNIDAGLQAALGIASSGVPSVLPVNNLQGETVAKVRSYAGIRADSENKENAWNFLRLLLQEESLAALAEKEGNCPVSKKASEEVIQMFASGIGLKKYGDSENIGVKQRDGNAVSPGDSFLESFLEMVCHSRICILDDSASINEFHDMMALFYEGESTYDECLGAYELNLDK